MDTFRRTRESVSRHKKLTHHPSSHFPSDHQSALMLRDAVATADLVPLLRISRPDDVEAQSFNQNPLSMCTLGVDRVTLTAKRLEIMHQHRTPSPCAATVGYLWKWGARPRSDGEAFADSDFADSSLELEYEADRAFFDKFALERHRSPRDQW
ncbi:hypothetical protein NM688_g4655 [Phlebia brevispora]|uniref:Uncharacterized protein n=1 Tax=Phlebia brevispora TaxID=194682 RepID=A0ACC1T221_9APHY|nr:hypothetical protein NM688_g4655 [Phlebia brevispora]